jgi:glutathione synthase/RimK-type ligase-like ATP-grasp enzyme
LIYESVQVVDQLNSRKREIRSIRGFILYALEIMETDKNYQILETNLEPFFWKNVKRVINQNKKMVYKIFYSQLIKLILRV